MALPPKITRSLQRATCDKIALDRCFLRLLCRFRQVARLLEDGEDSRHSKGCGKKSHFWKENGTKLEK